MVLQREPLQAKIWGWADAGNTVAVNFNNQVRIEERRKGDGRREMERAGRRRVRWKREGCLGFFFSLLTMIKFRT